MIIPGVPEVQACLRDFSEGHSENRETYYTNGDAGGGGGQ